MTPRRSSAVEHRTHTPGVAGSNLAAATNHLDALMLRLSHERERLARAGTPAERALRAVWITQIEREIASEELVLGINKQALTIDDDALLDALGM